MTRVWFAALCALALCLTPAAVHAQGKDPPKRNVRFIWNKPKTRLYVSVSFRDVIDSAIKKKLSRGLPTTIVMTGAIYQAGSTDPLSTTAQTCKITWHVWDEYYLIEITRPGGTRFAQTLTIEGVLRRCAEVSTRPYLLVGTKDQVPTGIALYMEAKVQVNPVSPELLQKIKKWVLRPTGTGTAAPGDALFSTFTGLFLQRIGDAERELKFTTKSVVPRVPK